MKSQLNTLPNKGMQGNRLRFGEPVKPTVTFRGLFRKGRNDKLTELSLNTLTGHSNPVTLALLGCIKLSLS